MRSYTDDALPGRCPRCWVITSHCLCAAVPRVETAVEPVVVRHHFEAWKSTNTARIASLALARLSFVEWSDDLDASRAALGPLIGGGGVWLVFPGPPVAKPLPGPPHRLIVLDGSWRQTRRMVRKYPALAALPRLSLPPKDEPVRRLRRPPFEGGRSTLEAIADTLRLLGETAAADQLDALHARYVELVLRARGRW